MSSVDKTNNITAGSIYRIYLQNFVTYSEVELFPGTSLNLIIGPNGTGKSTFVSAIILGLCGTTNLIGRTNKVSDFVRSGSDKATIEIELYQERGQRNVIIKRTIFKSNNKSKWCIDNKDVNEDKVKKYISKFNIQVDNLCQLLPQDRVHEFSSLNPQQLLKSTLSAIDKEKVNQLDQLIDNCNSKKILSVRMTQIENELNRLQRENDGLRSEYDAMLEGRKLKEDIIICKLKELWVEYINLSLEIKNAEDNKKEMEKKLKNHERKLKDIEDRVKIYSDNVKRMTMERDNFTSNSLELKNTTKQQMNSIKSNEDAIRQAESLYKQFLIQEENRQNNIAAEQVKLNKLINDRQNLGNVTELRRNSQRYQLLLDEKNRQIANKRGEKIVKLHDKNSKEKEIERCQKSITNHNDMNNKRLMTLKNVSEDTFRAVVWFRENQHLFQEACEPMMLVLQFAEPQYAAHVEATVPRRDLLAFTFTSGDDMNRFLRHVRGAPPGLALRAVSAVCAPPRAPPPRAPPLLRYSLPRSHTAPPGLALRAVSAVCAPPRAPPPRAPPLLRYSLPRSHTAPPGLALRAVSAVCAPPRAPPPRAPPLLRYSLPRSHTAPPGLALRAVSAVCAPPRAPPPRAPPLLRYSLPRSHTAPPGLALRAVSAVCAPPRAPPPRAPPLLRYSLPRSHTAPPGLALRAVSAVCAPPRAPPPRAPPLLRYSLPRSHTAPPGLALRAVSAVCAPPRAPPPRAPPLLRYSLPRSHTAPPGLALRAVSAVCAPPRAPPPRAPPLLRYSLPRSHTAPPGLALRAVSAVCAPPRAPPPRAPPLLRYSLPRSHTAPPGLALRAVSAVCAPPRAPPPRAPPLLRYSLPRSHTAPPGLALRAVSAVCAPPRAPPPRAPPLLRYSLPRSHTAPPGLALRAVSAVCAPPRAPPPRAPPLLRYSLPRSHTAPPGLALRAVSAVCAPPRAPPPRAPPLLRYSLPRSHTAPPGLALRAVSAVCAPPRAPPPRAPPLLSHLGFHSYLLDKVECPAAVQRYLRGLGLAHVPLGDHHTYENAEKVPPRITCFFAGRHKITARTSRYSGAVVRSTQELAPARLLAAAPDRRALADLTHSLSRLRVERNNLQEELQIIEDDLATLNSEHDEINERKKCIDDIIDRESKLSALITNKTNNIRSMTNEPSAEQKKESCDKRKMEAVLNQCELHQKLCKSFIKLQDYIMKREIVTIKLSKYKQKDNGYNSERKKCQNDLKECKDILSKLETDQKKKTLQANEKVDTLKQRCRNKLPNEKGFPYRREFDNLPNNLEDLERYRMELTAKMNLINSNDQEIETYEKNLQDILNLDLELSEKRKDESKLKELSNRLKTEWLRSVESMVENISKNFSDMFRSVNCEGKVSLDKGQSEDEFDKYGIGIWVKFRDESQLMQLSRSTQSGGERALSTALYLLALQRLARVPFRCVDEINQGMDVEYERKTLQLLIQVTTETNCQYFLLTPKLLPDLHYNRSVMVHTIMNGKQIMNYKEWNYKDIVKRAKRRSKNNHNFNNN